MLFSLSLLSLPPGWPATRQLESLAGFQESVPTPRLLMTLQTLVVLAHSVNVALSSPRLMDAFRFQAVRRHWTLGIRSPKPESQALRGSGPWQVTSAL